ncbi:hypothetical protein EAI_02355 [Harpegnathos saltator]|uniref:Mitochondrial splicing suppressor 51-like C-terminal domain-containing protein n=1 Tax=Harpegnathos saltator TaxID=610380 RepID=E2C0L8_HARSA|nr:hypothetical protein EAI_02355 [Harpegnathos saltator]
MEHKMIHYVEHKAICEVMMQVLIVEPQSDIHRYNDWQEWIQTRKELMKTIRQNLNRSLEPYEKQMILWSKTCFICHQQAELKTCQRCFSANYCEEHANAFRTKHDGYKCDQMMLMLNIDIEIISGRTSNISYGFLPFVNEKSRFDEMLEFYIENIIKRRKDIDWLAKDYIRSDYLSEPLTVYYGYKTLDILKDMKDSLVVIHIIFIKTIKPDYKSAWEILLHILPNIKHLVVLMIGRDLKGSRNVQNVCENCKIKKKSLSFYSFPLSCYKIILNSCKFKVPNVIVGFDVEFDGNREWLESMKRIFRRKLPLLFTLPSQQKVQNIIIKLQNIFGKTVKAVINKRNYFAGLMPHKDVSTGDIYFCNERLIILMNCDAEKVGDDNSDTTTDCNFAD